MNLQITVTIVFGSPDDTLGCVFIPPVWKEANRLFQGRGTGLPYMQKSPA